MGLISSVEETAANAIVPGSGALLHIGRWLRAHWQTLVVVGAVFALALTVWRAPWAESRQKAKDQAVIAAKQKTIDDMTAASAKALAENEANVARINGLQNQITKGRNDETPQRIADGATAIDAWIRMHPAPKVHPGSSGENHASGLSNTAAQPDAPGSEAVVSRDDLNACNTAYVTATGLQSWIRDQGAIQR